MIVKYVEEAFQSIVDNDIAGIHTFLDYNLCFGNVQLLQGGTIFTLALQLGRVEIVLLLLKSLYEYNELSNQKEIPSFKNARNELTKYPMILKALVNYGYLQQAVEDDSTSNPLHDAVIQDDVDALTAWLDAGAPVDLGSEQKKTALQVAITSERTALVSLLLARGANLDYAPYLSIAIIVSANHTIIGALTEAYINNPEKLRSDDVFGILQQYASNAEYKDILRTIILKYFGTLNHQSENFQHQGIPLLHLAMIYGGEWLALMALRNGANPHATTATGISTLHLAVMCNHQRLAALLMQKGVSPTTKDYTGATAVNHALNYTRTIDFSQAKFSSENLLDQADPFRVYDSYKQLRNPHLTSYANKIIQKNAHIHEQWKELYLIRLCSHLFHIETTGVLIPKQEGMQTIEYFREGMISPMKLLGKIAKQTAKMDDVFKNGEEREISEFFQFSSDEISRSNADYVQRIRQGKPTLILLGLLHHAHYMVIYGEYLAVCDASEEEINFYQLNPCVVTEDIIRQLRYGSAYTDSNTMGQNNLNLCLKTLGARKLSTSGALSQGILWQKQTVGNCTWLGLDSAMRALFIISGLRNENIDFAERNQELFDWDLKLRLYYANRYLERLESSTALFKPDHYLLLGMAGVFNSDIIRYGSNQAVSDTIERINRIYSLEELQLGERRDNNDGCFSHFMVTKPTDPKLTYLELFKVRM